VNNSTPDREENECANGIPFGFKDGRIWDIGDVERGAKCGCVCAACGNPLVAKKGEILRHHFAHGVGYNCATGLETSVHQMAKQIVADTLVAMLPGCGEIRELQNDSRWRRISNPPKSDGGWLFSPEKRRFRDAVPEVSVTDTQTGELLRPDVLCDSGRFWLEFRVTHAVDQDKAQKIARRKVECLEIDLRPFIKDWLNSVNQKGPTPVTTKLTSFITDSVESRKWIASSRIEMWFEQNVVFDEDQLGLVDDTWGKSQKKSGPNFW